MNNQYQKKLIALLEGLECQNINELMEKSPEHLKRIGMEISKHAWESIKHTDFITSLLEENKKSRRY